LGESG
jgi:Leucine-rich repeat (LRR) protein